MKPEIAARFINTPIALRPDHAASLIAEIRSGEKPKPTPQARARMQETIAKPYVMLEPIDGQGGAVAYIPVHGVLTQRSTWDWFSMTTGYDAIRFAFMAAVGDPDAAGILLDIDSPGGEVCGCFDLVDMIYAARGTKPIIASLNESAYSAGYAIASGADKIYMPRTGGVGSVGCIMLHMDMSGMLQSMGVTPTIIQYGKHKADGTDVEPLNAAARKRFQADIDAMGEIFVATIARNRGMTVAKVRATEAATFMGAKGVEIGFADGIKSPLGAIRALQQAVA